VVGKSWRREGLVGSRYVGMYGSTVEDEGAVRYRAEWI